MIKVSIIVPIYNVEKQLAKCLDSLLNQTLKDIQIILVNDGSEDSSAEIAKKYVVKDPDRVLYFEKANGGLSDARNYGLKYATGEYISFVDSDDYITENLYTDLLPYMEQKYDMIKFKIAKVDEQGNVLEKNYTPLFEEKSGEEAFDILYKADVMTEVAWGYLYKRDFFRRNKFEFTKGKYHEDFGLIPLILLKADKVASVDVFGYNYVQTQKSITRGNTEITYKRALDLLYFYDEMVKKIKEYKISEKSKENIKIYYTNCIILEVNNLNGKEQKQFIKEIRKRKLANNIKARDVKQFIKKILLKINIKLYLKLR